MLGQEQKTKNQKCELSLKNICRSNAKSNKPSYREGGKKNMKNKLLPFYHVCDTLVNRWNEQSLLAKVLQKTNSMTQTRLWNVNVGLKSVKPLGLWNKISASMFPCVQFTWLGMLSAHVNTNSLETWILCVRTTGHHESTSMLQLKLSSGLEA